MKRQESTLELGLLILGIVIAGAMTILIAGRTISFSQNRFRRAQPQPTRGDIEPERHQHISTVAAR